MLSDYLDELWEIKKQAPQTQTEKQILYAELTASLCTNWIDIQECGELIGFLIIGTAPNCHPDAHYYIQEAYIRPAFRNQGHMSSVVSAFMRDHPGIYCLFILNENHKAKRFWKRVFADLNYCPCCLADVGAGDEFCTQFGFKPKQKKNN